MTVIKALYTQRGRLHGAVIAAAGKSSCASSLTRGAISFSLPWISCALPCRCMQVSKMCLCFMVCDIFLAAAGGLATDTSESSRGAHLSTAVARVKFLAGSRKVHNNFCCTSPSSSQNNRDQAGRASPSCAGTKALATPQTCSRQPAQCQLRHSCRHSTLPRNNQPHS